jgi:two-component system, NarL family, sensor histidine kinase DesK
MGLLPDNKQHGWVPYVWLVFLVFFVLQPISDHGDLKQWALTGFGVVVFLVLYFALYRICRPWSLLFLGGIVLLGMAYAPFNHGAMIFFIYCAALLPFQAHTSKRAFQLLAVVVALIGLESWVLHLPRDFWVSCYVVVLPVGTSNIFFAQRNRDNQRLRLASEEIEHLAKVAERERIARDLHDVLGHTLSVIILKSELAGKLIDRDPQRAKAEIADVEQTSRSALAEVRSTIRGYRSQSLAEEFRRAKATLETAGLTVQSETAELKLTAAQESVVALIVREAVTNVVRHAQARHCHLRLEPVNGCCRLEIRDDGRGGLQLEGNGLRGMRERIEALGGTLERDTSAGTRLTVQFPIPADSHHPIP